MSINLRRPRLRSWIGLLLLAASACIANGDDLVNYPTRRIGSIEATFAQSQISIRRGGQRWLIDLTKIVRGIDCAAPPPPSYCDGLPASPCPDCARVVPEFVAWDEAHQKLYFAFTTSNSWDKPYQVLSYSLVTRRVSRLTNTWTAVFELGTVSKNGRYLAYSKVHHTSPAGGCMNSTGALTDVEVVDLWSHKVGKAALNLPGSHDIFSVEKLEWPTPAMLACTVRKLNQDCKLLNGEPPIRVAVDVRNVQLR